MVAKTAQKCKPIALFSLGRFLCLPNVSWCLRNLVDNDCNIYIFKSMFYSWVGTGNLESKLSPLSAQI